MNERKYAYTALCRAQEDWHGKLSRYEAHLCDGPADYGMAFIPAYRGFHHDDERYGEPSVLEFFTNLK